MMRQRRTLELPVDRYKLFVFTYRTHLGFLVRLSLLLALFGLPMWLSGLITEGIQGSLSAEQLATEDMTAYRTFLVRGMLGGILNIPAELILGLGLMGAFCLMKEYTFADGYTFAKSFWGGIRSNWKEATAVTLIWSIVKYLTKFSHLYLSLYGVDLYAPMAIITLVLRLILLCVYLFTMAQISVYQGRVVQLCKNGFLFVFSRLLPTMGIVCVTFAPMIATDLFGSGIIRVILLCLYATVLWGNAVLSITLWCQHCFDETVNRTQYPEIYHRGLCSEGMLTRKSVLRICPEALPPQKGEQAPHTLTVENLRMSYDGLTDAFSNISFSCTEGFFCISGASGCGKSSLLRTIAGLEIADEGAILLDGRDITDMKAHKRRMAFIFQDGGLYSHLTAYQNLYLVCRDDAKTKAFLEAFGLMAYINWKPRYLSGGECQRLAMAKCLATEADLYLMDEPLTAVDPQSRREIFQLLRQWQQQKHATVLYVSHNMEEIGFLADQHYIFREETSVSTGTA